MNDINLFLLLGIAIVVIGFLLKLDSIGVVIVAAIVTALIGKMDFNEILRTLGSNFIKLRGASMFILTLPIIGVSERYGLREQAVKLIQKFKDLTAGRLIWFYHVVRQTAAALSLRLGGHPQFVRPLIYPMAEAAAQGEVPKGKHLNEASTEDIKAAAAAAENYGNFFGQNLFPAASGVALIVATLGETYETVTSSQIALWSIPVFVIVLILSGIQFTLLDRKIKKRGKR